MKWVVVVSRVLLWCPEIGCQNVPMLWVKGVARVLLCVVFLACGACLFT